MIAKITGTLVTKRPPSIVVDVGGLGYEVDVPMSTFYSLPATGERVSLVTHFIVREDAQLLYGFATEAERASFRQLLKVSGVGPKVGLAVLSGMSVDELASVIVRQDVTRLTQVPGIGKKTAERILLELRGKGASMGAAPVDGKTVALAPASEVQLALLALGYNEKESEQALKSLPADCTTNDGIRLALKYLAK